VYAAERGDSKVAGARLGLKREEGKEKHGLGVRSTWTHLVRSSGVVSLKTTGGWSWAAGGEIGPHPGKG
jgi:hypothetical protein